MDIDSPPPEPNSLSPQFRVVRRLALQGVPEENFEQLQPGLVAYVKENKFRVPELVSAILPSDDEALETAAAEAQHESTKNRGGPSLQDQFRESMIWLQWLMFESEPDIALNYLAELNVGQRGVCGAVWGDNDIAYRCRTCEHDPTCAICVPCFQNGNHQDHDYSIIYTGGGCCDCGDVTAWKRDGFCSKHKGAEKIQPLPQEFADSVGPVLESLLLCWKKKLQLAENIFLQSPIATGYTKLTDELTCAVVDMLLNFCQFSESLLCFVSSRVYSLDNLLDILVRAERFLGDAAVKKLHNLLLKLLGEPLFKYEFAKVFLSYYPTVVNEAVKECNDKILKKYPLLSTFSVQIFTVPTLTPRLVKEVNLLSILLECLGEIFCFCEGDDFRLQVSTWGNLYEITLRVVEDIRFVMSHSVVPKYVARDRHDISRTWMKLLAFVQGMSPEKRETGIHIEEENDSMHLPFVLGHSIANIHSLLVAGAFSDSSIEDADCELFCDTYSQDFDDQDSQRHAKVGRLSQESNVSSVSGRSSTADYAHKTAEITSDIFPVPTSASLLLFECLRAIEHWLVVDNTSSPFLNVLSPKITSNSGKKFFALKRTLSKIKKGKLRPNHTHFPTVGMEQETGSTSVGDNALEGEYMNEAFRALSLSDWPDISYDVSSQEISLHIPLHRLLSLILQITFRRCYGDKSPHAITAGPDQLSVIHHDFFGHVLGGCHPYGFSAFVMEHPLRIRVFCAEVHAGMWRKNGDAAILSCEWYRSVRWSEQGLELDLFLLQCCAALAPSDLYVNRIIDRFGLSSYLSLDLERSSEYEPVLMQEMLSLIIQIVKERRFCGLTPAECLQRELIYKLSTGDSTHSQLVKSLPRDLSKIGTLQEILDKVAVYSNPSGINQGMYKLRLAYYKELDLYHPRWTSRDLQIAEERYLRFCNVSALATQLPKWTNIYNPLNGLARIATSKPVLELVRATLYYAVFTDKSTISRAPDGVLVIALHLLSLAIDICYMWKESGEWSNSSADSVPILAFAGEEIKTGTSTGCNGHSLLSLLVSLMKIHRLENPENLAEAGSLNLSSLIDNLLKKFAELDHGCMTRLQRFAPEVVNKLLQAKSNSDKSITALDSESDKRKAKARERQAAVLEKMRAQQSKFMASVKSSTDEGLDASKVVQEVSSSDGGPELEDAEQVICSLCHDPKSKSPLSFLILLQKSRLLGLVDRGPPSWDLLEKKCVATSIHTTSTSSPRSNVSTSSELSSSQLTHLIQNAVNEFASHGQPREVNAFLEFVRSRFPATNIQLPDSLDVRREGDLLSLESLEERMYVLIRGAMHDNLMHSDLVDKMGSSAARDDVMTRNEEAKTLLLGKYIAAFSKESLDNPSPSGSTSSHNKKPQSKSTTASQAYDGFSPSDCDGIYLSSCGHAVHQACLDRYLSSLKDRYIRRIVFEGGHIVDPDQGEFLCPVCRGLANSVLPALPGDSEKLCRLPIAPARDLSDSAVSITPCNAGVHSLHLQQASALLLSAAKISGNDEIIKATPMQHNGRIRPDPESIFRVLCGMYFPGKDKIVSSGRVSQSMIMWDTLKYSIMSTEIAARSCRTSLLPEYSQTALLKELKSSSGFILSLLLKNVQNTRTKDALSFLLRLKGIKLFAESICSGFSVEKFPSHPCRQGGNMLCILENAETELRYPDIQFWARASDPILARDAFSSLMWVLFCLPWPTLVCEESFLSLVHIFYAVTITQAILTYRGKRQCSITELGYHDCLVSDIYKFMEESGVPQQYFVSNYTDTYSDIKDYIRSLSFPYLRRCALLWKVIHSSMPVPFSHGAHVSESSSNATDVTLGYETNCSREELTEVEELEKMFKISPMHFVLRDEVLRSLASKWLRHFSQECKVRSLQCTTKLTPTVPYKLMLLPHLYQDLLQRYIKQTCSLCGKVPDDPALCLLCGDLCSPNWRPCCKKSGCQAHAMICGAGTGVFLLIRKTTILLQRSARQAPWPSPYLDMYGEEDIEMHRGKPLYLNQERYAALTYMVASHGLDRSSKVLRQTTVGGFFML
ncbi:E3 ubiquitin-protein ligase PRT6 isoform X2 [Daucus carota subsp. sativus]|uniref:E3 ubiquitin-protein ligase PRT6 isoform X2 n=1 Tax=Daucus carota subsp. sativus TaxID=79200 RepID=UPI0007EFC45D|nr:PREDICTED: E3 ubiquitin-protein ligase PRT6 isoform X2 [Daucus carota subsp. sativus]